MKKMGTNSKNSVFLDVDPTIVEKNLRFKTENEDEFDKLFGNSGNNEKPAKLVKPSPGFCVKTHEVATNKKIFVNICHTDGIPAPKDVSEQDIQRIIDTEDASFRIPMSIGQMREETDKKGETVKVFDIAINPIFFNKIQNSALFKNFFLSIAFEALQNKYTVISHDDKIILNNRKVFGTLQMHWIRDDDIKKNIKNKSASIIEELTGENKQNVVIETISSNDYVTKEPEYVLYKKKGQNCLYGEFKLPDIISAKEITLDIGEDRILLESQSKAYLLDIFVPGMIRQDKCTSSFEKTTKILTVTMPLMGG